MDVEGGPFTVKTNSPLDVGNFPNNNPPRFPAVCYVFVITGFQFSLSLGTPHASVLTGRKRGKPPKGIMKAENEGGDWG